MALWCAWIGVRVTLYHDPRDALTKPAKRFVAVKTAGSQQAPALQHSSHRLSQQ
jgi:hypothetical protein